MTIFMYNMLITSNSSDKKSHAKKQFSTSYKLSTFLSVDMEILTLWSSQVHPEAQPKCVQATEGC
jgi:hypothetical protein